MQETAKTLLEAAQQIGGYRAIGLIAEEGQRRLKAAPQLVPLEAANAGRTLVKAFAFLVEQQGDTAAAAYLQDAIAIYQKELRKRGLVVRAELWTPAWKALERTSQKALEIGNAP